VGQVPVQFGEVSPGVGPAIRRGGRIAIVQRPGQAGDEAAPASVDSGRGTVQRCGFGSIGTVSREHGKGAPFATWRSRTPRWARQRWSPGRTCWTSRMPARHPGAWLPEDLFGVPSRVIALHHDRHKPGADCRKAAGRVTGLAGSW